MTTTRRADGPRPQTPTQLTPQQIDDAHKALDKNLETARSNLTMARQMQGSPELLAECARDIERAQAAIDQFNRTGGAPATGDTNTGGGTTNTPSGVDPALQLSELQRALDSTLGTQQMARKMLGSPELLAQCDQDVANARKALAAFKAQGGAPTGTSSAASAVGTDGLEPPVSAAQGQRLGQPQGPPQTVAKALRTVHSGDSMEKLAREHLSAEFAKAGVGRAPTRQEELNYVSRVVSANPVGTRQADGASIKNVNLVMTGWQLNMPSFDLPTPQSTGQPAIPLHQMGGFRFV